MFKRKQRQYETFDLIGSNQSIISNLSKNYFDRITRFKRYIIIAIYLVLFRHLAIILLSIL